MQRLEADLVLVRLRGKQGAGVTGRDPFQVEREPDGAGPDGKCGAGGYNQSRNRFKSEESRGILGDPPPQ